MSDEQLSVDEQGLPEGWKVCRLGDVARVQTGPYGSQLKNNQYIIGGTPVVTVEHIRNFKVADFNYPSVTAEDKERLSKYLLKQGDIIFSRVGSVDLSAYISKYQDGWLFSSRMLRVRADEEIISKFLSYYFRQKKFRDYLINIAVGATMPSINTEILKSVDISYPPLPEQKAIAEVLSSLDDKIDLLHQQNKTLEDIAQTLFRQWFVERADEGWEQKTLGDIADNSTVSIKPTEIISNTHYIGLEHIERKHISLMKSGNSNVVTSSKYVFYENDILFGKLRPYFHKVCFTAFNGVCSTDILVIRPKTDELFALTLFAFYQDDVVNYANAGSTGTRMPRTNWDTLKTYPILLPNNKVIEKFNEKVLPMIEKIKQNQQQVKTLEQTRDTLLPKLMSGEVRLK